MVFNEDYHINMLMSNKDVYIRFNKFQSGEINKLFIQGLSGSGKSSLARELAQRFNCPCIELDKFRGNVYYTDEEIKREHPYIYKYFQTEFTKGDRHNIAKMEPEERREEFEKFVYWLLKQPERMVIEGALEKILYDNDEMRKTYPMVFKGTSMLKSMARMSWREFHRDHPGRDPIDNLLWWVKWCTKYKKMADQHNKVREKIMGDVDMDDYEEREENDLPLIMEAMGYKPHPIIFSDDAKQAVMDQEYEELEESFLPELTFYHGSRHKLDKILPMAFSAGNKLKDPSWGVFMFRQKDLAEVYAIMTMVRHVCREKDIPKPRGWLEKDGFMHYGFTIILPKESYDRAKEAVMGLSTYVYTLEVPIDRRLDVIGTTGLLPEYVYSGVPKTVKREEIVIDSVIFDKIITKVSMKEYNKITNDKPYNVVGPWMDWFVNIEERERMRKLVKEKIDSGEIKPGDDLGWLKESANIKHTFTHKELCDIYQNQMITENTAIYIPHESGNITQYSPGAYFNEEVGVWMRKPNQEEQIRLNVINESFSGYEFHPLIETKPVWDPKLWRDPGPHIRNFDIKRELKTFMYPQAIKEKYKGPNFYINLPGLSKDKRFRVRCEMIILDSEGRMLVDRKRTFKRMNLSYDNTGGGIDSGEDIVDAAAREAQEEARITVKDPMDSMLYYAYEFPEETKRNYGYWGVASFICVARKKSMYKGYIKVDDRDGFLTRSEWIKPEDIKDLLPAHKQAIDMYKNFYLQESLGINMEFLNNEYV